MSNRIVHFLLIVAVALLAYSNTFHVPFIFDDDPNITNNHLIKSFEYFFHPSEAEGERIYYEFRSRMVGYLTFALNYHVHGLDVTGYHIVNLAVHVINGWLVYWLLLLTFRTPYFSRWADSGGPSSPKEMVAVFVALFSALFFISHPIQTQAVTYIVQRFASLATLFYLLSFALYVSSRLVPWTVSDRKQRRVKVLLYAGSLIFALLGVKTKEMVVTLPLMIIVYEALFLEGTIKERVLHIIPTLLIMTIVPLTWMNVSMANASQAQLSSFAYLYTQFRVIITYVRLILLPVNQNLDYDYAISHSPFEPAVVLSFLLLLLIFTLALYLVYRSRGKASTSRLTAFGIIWFFIALGPESSVIPIRDVIFEHRVYLPSVGFFMAAASLLYRPSHHRLCIAALSVIVLVWLSAAFSRNEIWGSRLGLWSDTAQKSPGNARALNNLANCYLIEDRNLEALLEYSRAHEADPGYLETYTNLFALGSYLEKGGHFREAAFAYNIICSKAPELFRKNKAVACDKLSWLAGSSAGKK